MRRDFPPLGGGHRYVQRAIGIHALVKSSDVEDSMCSTQKK